MDLCGKIVEILTKGIKYFGFYFWIVGFEDLREDFPDVVKVKLAECNFIDVQFCAVGLVAQMDSSLVLDFLFDAVF